MPPRPSDRVLRKLITDLAGRPKADVRGVLAGLDTVERRRVEQLIAEFRGVGAPAAPTEPMALATGTEGLSPWLAARVHTAADGAPAGEFTMTRRALESLKDAVASVGVERRPAATATDGRFGHAVFDLVSRWLSGPAR